MRHEDIIKAEDALRRDAEKRAQDRLEQARARGDNPGEDREHLFSDKRTETGVRYYKTQEDPRTTDEDYEQWHARVVFVVVPYPARGLKDIEDQKSICDAVAARIRRKNPQRAVVASYKDLEANGRSIPLVVAAVTAKNPMRFSAIRNSLSGVGSGDTRVSGGTMDSLPRFVATQDPSDGPFIYGDFKPAGRRGRPAKKSGGERK